MLFRQFIVRHPDFVRSVLFCLVWLLPWEVQSVALCWRFFDHAAHEQIVGCWHVHKFQQTCVRCQTILVVRYVSTGICQYSVLWIASQFTACEAHNLQSSTIVAPKRTSQ